MTDKTIQFAIRDEHEKEMRDILIQVYNALADCKEAKESDLFIFSDGAKNEAGKEKVTYVKMTAEKAEEVVNLHLKGGNVVTKYVIDK